ncbi:Rad4-domain-containing protein [Mytilinidion resinicola]|uniref:Rad4-domain-containing protein n=1 Tax=Mytilinidion resinicola TaxID=574789 RepID=A0A6A6Y7N2_9PEZI|nr:Rad4-domain-containing protein [Mytilinidion resinicola]KAF2804558.1 Rad4-domain-containing protein [Mytilinidion resinicola]
MAGARGRPRKTADSTNNRSTARTRSSRKTTKKDADIPDVFQDLLAEAAPSASAGPDEDNKPLKKRKTARSTRIAEPGAQPPPTTTESRTTPQRDPSPHTQDDSVDNGYNGTRLLQTVTDYSEESEESDLEWEDVGIDQAEEGDQKSDEERPIGDISIVLGGDKNDQKARKQVRRKGVTAAEKKLRLDIHKMHILCLLYHVHLRNAWCNDFKTQATLRKLVNVKLIEKLAQDPEQNQGQSSALFLDGLVRLKDLWSQRFSITAMGLHKPRWADSEEAVLDFNQFDELDPPMECPDFRTAAHTLRGSQDVGAQLFCALLRGIGVEARLVCSLQCLPFSSVAQSSTPQSISKTNRIVLDPYNSDISPSKSTAPVASASNTPSTPLRQRPVRLSKLGQFLTGQKTYDAGKAPPLPKPKKNYHTAYPVYWVEAFDFALQKWIVVDPHSSSTANRPDKIEPPMSYSQNTLSYAVAFEEDLSARDVTPRYAKALNAKTRKARVESTEGGAKWWKKALKIFRRRTTLDRDQVEDAQLARREAAEGIPRNVQDFKGHPIYVLERHLRHNEIIQPKNQVGKINVGSATASKMEPIYRRRDVHVVRSGDKWYRMGREVKEGEQPLKHAKPRKGARSSLGPDELDAEDMEDVGVGLYAGFQTELYVPPPVVRGRVPRNAFGNLDIYVPSMIPMGGVHIRALEAAKAARTVGVDFADAVTGFQFRGRHGTAVIQGIIVAAEYREAIEAVLKGMLQAQEDAQNALRSAEALRLWRRFSLGLRIAQRVAGYEIKEDKVNLQEELDQEEEHLDEQQMAGGFFPGANLGTIDPMEARNEYEHEHFGFDGTSRGRVISDVVIDFIPENANSFGSSLLEQVSITPRSTRTIPQHQESLKADPGDIRGSFIPDSPGDQGRRFIPDEEVLPEESHRVPPRQQSDPMEMDTAGGFIVDDISKDDSVEQLEPAQLPVPAESRDSAMQKMPQSSQPSAPASVSMTAESDSTSQQPAQDGTSIQVEEQAAEIWQDPKPAQPADNDEQSSDEDRNSLLSEDPEDEDADPDWLVYTT